MSSSQTVFSIGELIAMPSGATPTGIRCGILQDVSVDESATFKELRGSYKYPLDVADAETKISITAKVGAVDPLLFNLFYNGTLTSGETRTSIMEPGAVPASSTFVVTVANSATFVTDLLVWDVTAQKFLTRVTGTLSTGQYSVTGGVYTFFSDAASHAVQITYTYTVATAAGVGSTITIANTKMGSGFSPFALYLPSVRSTSGKQLYEKYNNVVCTGMKRAFKNDDFMLTDMTFTAYADASGNVKTISANGMAS